MPNLKLTSVSTLFIFALVPIISFAPNYYVELISLHEIWSGVCNCIHEDPNWALWFHVLVMPVWIVMFFLQILGHPGAVGTKETVKNNEDSQNTESGGSNNNSESTSSSADRSSGTVLPASSVVFSTNPNLQTPLLQSQIQSQNISNTNTDDNRENDPSVLAQAIANNRLPDFIKNNRFLPLRNFIDLRRLHQLNGYAAWITLISSITTATFFWIFIHGYAILKKDEATGTGYAVWALGIGNLEGNALGLKDETSGGKKPVHTADAYTKLLWFMITTQMSTGIFFAYLMRRKREQIASGQASAVSGRSRSELLTLHKFFLLGAILWLSDPAIHRLVFWSRIVLLKYVWWPTMHYDQFHAYMSGDTGDWEIFKVWADNDGQYFVLAIGKMWVNLLNTLIIGWFWVCWNDEKKTKGLDINSNDESESSGTGGTSGTSIERLTDNWTFSSLIYEIKQAVSYPLKIRARYSLLDTKSRAAYTSEPNIIIMVNLFFVQLAFWSNCMIHLIAYEKPIPPLIYGEIFMAFMVMLLGIRVVWFNTVV